MARKVRATHETATQPTAAVGVASAKKPRVTIRHYCQGIGDCHLLSFMKTDGTIFRMLIDCGIHPSISGGADLIDAIVTDIKQVTGGKIDVLVVTHEHWDHVSGFSTASEIFKDFTFGEVWMPWTENPADPVASQFDKFKDQALSALQQASKKLEGERQLSLHLSAVRDGLQSILGFQFGAKGERVRAARDAAAKLAKGKAPIYLGPDSPPISIDDIPDLRIYVLGPPRDKQLLQLEERASEMYGIASRNGWPLERALNAGLAADNGSVERTDDNSSPFDRNQGADLSAVLGGFVEGEIAQFVQDNYSGPVAEYAHAATNPAQETNDENLADQSWRRIDADWLSIAADLALQMDRGVNNTSLVLAFEFTNTGRVLLFPGDAQVGNWLSWRSVKWQVNTTTVNATDLLARTVYLKVAHHGSQNATLRQHGLDLMTDADLSAFIPTNEADARKVRWHEMPFEGIMTALAAKTSRRVIRADDEWISKSGGKPSFPFPSGSILSVRTDSGPWVELDIA